MKVKEGAKFELGLRHGSNRTIQISQRPFESYRNLDLLFDCERMQRSPIHTFVVLVVVFDFQVCEIFVLNEGKLLTKHVDKTC